MQWFDKYQPVLTTKFEAVLSYGEQLIEACFNPVLEKKFRWLPWLWMSALFLIGAFMWGKFLNWGNIPFDYHDWSEINVGRIAFVRDAVLAPQMLLLGFFEIGPFIFINTLFLYLLGTFGLLWLRKIAQLSLVAYAIVFMLFNFNGHIISHMSVGHITWWAYFMYPLIIAMIFRLFDQKPNWRWIAGMFFVVFYGPSRRISPVYMVFDILCSIGPQR